MPAENSQNWKTLNEAAAMALQEKQFERAIQLYGQIIDLNGNHPEAFYKRANALNGLGRWDFALIDYDRAITLDPDYAYAHCNRGTVLEHLARWDEALASYDRAIALTPDDCIAYYNRGSALKELGRFEAALSSYQRALSLKSDYVAAYINCAHVLHKLKRYEAALASYDKAIQIEPINAEAFFGRGVSLVCLRRLRDAMASYERAIVLKDGYAEAFINRGIVLQELGLHQTALASFDNAIELNPAFAEAFQARGSTLHRMRQFEAAIRSFDRALELDVGRKYLLGMRLYAQMQMCDWRGIESGVQRLVEGLNAKKPVSVVIPVLALVDSPALHRSAAEIWMENECPPNEVLGAIPIRSRRDKIRVAYFSPDFRDHPVALLTAALFEVHDRAKFEIIAFAFGPESHDAVRARLERGFDRFLDVREQDDVEVTSLARRLEIDIAVDLGGFTEHCRTEIFAMRAAPIQISYLGYLGTMSAPYMDYLVADGTIIPDTERHNYAEKIVYLPSYQVNDSQRQAASLIYTREELGLPSSGFAFSCFNANYKIQPATFAMWMRILKRVHHSSLYIYVESEASEKNLLRAADSAGVDPRRIVFGRRLAREGYLARLRVMDLFLDTLPYNAGTTASDALWAGLPVLTLMGRSFASRVAASLLRAIDLPELIASTAEEYEEMAVQLAQNPQRMLEIRALLQRNRSISPLFDTRLFAAHLETAYVKMLQRHDAGLPPEDIYVSA